MRRWRVRGKRLLGGTLRYEVRKADENRIMIYGPKNDGTCIVGFRTAANEALAISIPRTEAGVVRYKGACPYGLFVPGRSMRNLWRAPRVCEVEMLYP